MTSEGNNEINPGLDTFYKTISLDSSKVNVIKNKKWGNSSVLKETTHKNQI